MPALNCKCGQRLNYGEIPCPDEWLFISDKAFDAFSDATDAEEIYRAMSSFLKCPRCGRLWVFWDGYESTPQEFVSAVMLTP